jgi:hypothetical protein
MPLAGIGMFQFEMGTLLFDDLQRSRSWRHARSERFGARPAGQYLGPGDDTVTISGRLVPQIAGRFSSIETLAEMATTGEAYPFVDGTGTIWGNYTIERLEDAHTMMIDQGRGQQIDFRIELSRAD